jgi:O-acetyl-ADP-ribose deacetylase
MIYDAGGTRIELIEGDIAEQDTDAVVTAAHGDLAGGQGTDGAIHYKAGPDLLKESRAIGFCDIGDAVMTGGYNLKARHVIHTVGPVWNRDKMYQARQLADCYRSSLRLAQDNQLRSVSFPSISTGAFCYPIRLAAPIALTAIVDYIEQHPGSFDLVRMVLYPRELRAAYAIYAAALQEVLAQRAGPSPR